MDATMSSNAGQSEDVPQFGALVRKHRIRIGLTQRELADFSTISVRAIRDLEQGKAKRPRQDTVRLIADGLRLGPRARADLESAAQQGRTGWALKAGYDAEPPAPPTALHALIGRESEAAAIEAELALGEERLINLVGLSGVGKTRLALEAAARLHAGAGFPVLWCTLDPGPADYRPASGPQGLDALAAACVEELFGCAPQGGPEPARREERGGLTAFADLVAGRPALLVVDGVAEQQPRLDRIARLLRECPELRVLVTSERPCRIPGERPFLLGPLALPTEADECEPATLARQPAVRLFLDRVRRIRPDYVLDPYDVHLVADLCRRLDGLPQALQTAASWLVVYDLETLQRSLAEDPTSLLIHLAGAEDGSRLRQALHRLLGELPAADRALLHALGEWGGDFGLDDVVALTGRGLADCGRMVRDLLLHGVVRASHQGGRSRFQVFNLVRAFQSTERPSGTPAAAGMPQELPQGVAGRVLDDVEERSGESLGLAGTIA